MGDITVENWPKEEPRPEKWYGKYGPEPTWFKKTKKRKVVTNADYTKSTLPDGALFAGVKLVNAKFEVRDGSRNSIDGLNDCDNALIRRGLTVMLTSSMLVLMVRNRKQHTQSNHRSRYVLGPADTRVTT